MERGKDRDRQKSTPTQRHPLLQPEQHMSCTRRHSEDGTAAVRKEMGEKYPGIMVHVALSHSGGVKIEKESDKNNHKETSSCSVGFSHSKQSKPIQT